MKKIILGLLLTTVMTGGAYAVTTATTPAYAPGKTSSLDFESLSKAEKIKLIETKHAEAKARADAKWKAMSDDEKIAKYEHRRQAFMARRNGATAPGSTVAPSAPPAVTAVPKRRQLLEQPSQLNSS